MDTEQARRRLEEERERLAVMLQHGEEGLDLQEEGGTGELSSPDQHPADLGSEILEREQSLSIFQNAETRLRDVEDAFARLEDGTYGTCEICGQPVGRERLAALPAARFCVEHQQRTEGFRDDRGGAEMVPPVEPG